MGLFDSLFGGGKKEAPKAKPAQQAPAAVAAPAGGIPPEVVAAISASVGMVMDDASPEVIAAVTAAIIHARGGCSALRIKRGGSAWAASGLQKIMDCRQMV